jgi:4-amino-4-deoxy-L-arabinose transferase-like glycosyltransferase
MRFERIATTAGAAPAVRPPTVALTGVRRLPEGPPVRRPGRVASDRASRVRLQVLDLLAPWVVGLATMAARLATAAAGPTDWDSAQYAAAVSHFDVNHGRPQPPGYWLYVEAGRLVHATGLSTVDSLVLVAALASALAAGLVVVAGRDLGGRWVGLAAGLVVATSPFAWFSGSVISTYSFDLAVAPLLMILAWRARPGSWHGAAALVALGLAAGFRQSVILSFALVALVAVTGSVRRFRQGVVALAAGAAAVVVWFVPMVLAQPGGIWRWWLASRSESWGAMRTTSVLDHAPNGPLNLGTFAAYTTVALAPLATLALLAAVGLGARALVRGFRDNGVPAGFSSSTITPGPRTGSSNAPILGIPAHRRRRCIGWTRPWFQSRTGILLAATLPPMAIVALVQFAKGGYLLAFLPGAVIALLLAPGTLLHAAPSPSGARRSQGRMAWGAVASVAVGAIAVVGADRFLAGPGVLPVRAQQSQHGLWITQARYQAPFADTRATIRSADAMDNALVRLGRLVDPRRDVVVIDSLDGGASFYRNAGWTLPAHRVVFISPGVTVYDQLGGSLFHSVRSSVTVAPGGSVYLIASPALPGLRTLAGTGKMTLVRPAGRIADYLVWRIAPGASILGVQVAVADGARPLGTGLVG